MFFYSLVDKASPGGKTPVKYSKPWDKRLIFFGLMYRLGEGVKVDNWITQEWLQLVVEFDNTTELHGKMCLDGIMVADNSDNAIGHFEEAVYQENLNAEVHSVMEYT
ncbi:hypothetical protein MAM1_0103c05321 [Mucor ambiguus]|uniref:Uncharacterized protein n=1 Tax=Mucor ambiguus TaxID=91626 RepID=A0A0C9LUY7_9FUNG|nr:hypothetical protein MAM1_0103c05321 [Mucor ambiguus]